jgi:HlyD family secretion protein
MEGEFFMECRMIQRGILVFVALMYIGGCVTKDREGFLGSSVIETVTTTLSAANGGDLVYMDVTEGAKVNAGQCIAMIDTALLSLKLKELGAEEMELKQQRNSLIAEKGSLEQNVKGLKRESERANSLAQKGAVPMQKKDDLETQYSSAEYKLSSVGYKIAALAAQEENLSSKREQIRYQIEKSRVVSPESGIVLTVYKRRGEVVGPGNPVVEIGTFDTVRVDFFVPQTALAGITMGMQVYVRCDMGDKSVPIFAPAYVSWINNEAEFTPENIQTRESRNGLVFRVQALAPNPEGVLKRSMPVEIWKDKNTR